MIRALAKRKSQVVQAKTNEATEEEVAINLGRNKTFAEVKRLLDIKHKQYFDDKEWLLTLLH